MLAQNRASGLDTTAGQTDNPGAAWLRSAHATMVSCMNRLSGLLVFLPIALLAACAKPDTPQVAGPLVIDIPELCTKCVEVLRCEGSDRRTVYVMAEKDTWAQIVTIWDYMALFFRPKLEDFRNLTIYELGADDQARLDVWQRRVELPEAVVYQKTGEWLALDGQAIGTCRQLPRIEDRAFAQQLEERSR